jgi:hypothetical protein
MAPSDLRLRHAALTARLDLARAERSQGRLKAGDLAALETLAAGSLQVDPESEASQGDWLACQGLKARLLTDQGRDPGPTLRGALDFYVSRTREPRAPDLREAHMVLCGLLAQYEADHGRSPDQPLAEALRDAGHSCEGHPDALEDLRALKARLEAHPHNPARADRRWSGGSSAQPAALKRKTDSPLVGDSARLNLLAG